MTYKARPKGSAGWRDFEYCTIGISIGNPNCAGHRLEAMVTWLNAQTNFKGCIIDLSDTLNRYNLMLEEGLSEDEARTKASAEGDAWLSANQHILDKIKIQHEVFRWEQWMKNPEIKDFKEQFLDAFKKDEAFRTAVLHDVETYNKRHDRELWELERIDTMKYNINYLLEELAVHSFIYQRGPVASLYPGSQQESFKMVRDGLVANVPQHMMNSHFVQMNVYDADSALTPSNGNKRTNGANGSSHDDQDPPALPPTGGSNGGGTSPLASVQPAFGRSVTPQAAHPQSLRPQVKRNRSQATVRAVGEKIMGGYSAFFVSAIPSVA